MVLVSTSLVPQFGQRSSPTWRPLSDLVFVGAGILVLRALITFGLLATVSPTDLGESWLFLLILPADGIGLLSIIVGMCAGGWRPLPTRSWRRWRILATVIGIGSAAIAEAVSEWIVR